MKAIMFKRVLPVLAGIFASIFMMLAQDVDMMLYVRDVNGVKIGTKMTYEQIVETFGEPDRVWEQDSGDNGIDKMYYYGENIIHTKDDVFDEFYIVDTRFVAFTYQIEGGLKVGDPFSKVDALKKYGEPYLTRIKSYCLFSKSDSQAHVFVENGVIISISYHDPV